MTDRELLEAAARALRDNGQARDMYWHMPNPPKPLEPCPVCGSDAVVWEFAEKAGDPVQRVVMCNNGERFGPQDGIMNDGCLLYMPPQEFYHGTGRDAARYWNEYAKALCAQRRGRNWTRAQVLRKDTPAAEIGRAS